MLSIIVAMAKNNVIGSKGKLLWRISEDFIRTKNLTMGHPLIMGQKTCESLPKMQPLPGRTNIVISNDPNFKAEGFVVVSSIEDGIAKAKESEGGEESFIFGGASIYQQTLPIVDKLYVTYIDKEIEGDVYFPVISADEWKLDKEEKRVVQFGEIDLTYYFREYVRKV